MAELSEIPEIRTPRLRLRGFRHADLDAYAAMCADEEVMRFIGPGGPISRAEAWRHIALSLGHWQLLGYGPWAVEELHSGELVGRVGFLNPEGWPGCELTWMLRRTSWGQGYATEAAQAALSFGQDTLRLSGIISLVHPANRRSVDVALRIGEVLSGETELYGKLVLVYAVPVSNK